MNEIVDLIADEPDRAFENYFDPSEFATRAWLEDRHYWHLYRRTVILDALRGAGVGGGHNLLELGCGAGTVATFLNQNGLRVDYSDVHREALRFARQRAVDRLPRDHPARFIRVDITRRLPPGPCDGVLLLDVLEHLPDDRGVLRAVRGLLGPTAAGSPQRLLLFTVPAFQRLWSPWDDRERHKRRYSLAEARALAADSGFQVTRATYFFLPLFFAAVAVKAARTTRRLVRGPAAMPAFQSMAETNHYAPLNAAILRLLGLERRWLRSRDLPLGTSILVMARPLA